MLVEGPLPIVTTPGCTAGALGMKAVPGCPGCCAIHAATVAESLPPAVTMAGNSSQPRSRSDIPGDVSAPGGRCSSWSYNRRSFSARAAGDASNAARSSNVRTPASASPLAISARPRSASKSGAMSAGQGCGSDRSSPRPRAASPRSSATRAATSANSARSSSPLMRLRTLSSRRCASSTAPPSTYCRAASSAVVASQVMKPRRASCS